MKIYYGFLSVFFIFYIFNIFNSINEEEELQLVKEKYKSIEKIKFILEVDKDNYLFKNEAWKIISQKKNKVIRPDSLMKSDQKGPITISKNKSPVEICDGVECYEYIALKNNSIVFYGKKSNGSTGFINISVGDYLNDRIKIQSRTNKKIVLFDLDFNQTVGIKIFDVNVSAYTPKLKMEH